jgi:hypothetical protein
MKQTEYTEGPEALENFEQLARTILQAPKPKLKARKLAKPATSRKPQKSDKD